MKNEEAIKILKPFRNRMVDQHGCPISDVVYALDVALAALRNQQNEDTAKRVTYYGYAFIDGQMVDSAECPNCEYIYDSEDPDWGEPFCPHCGQKLYWGAYGYKRVNESI